VPTASKPKIRNFVNLPDIATVQAGDIARDLQGRPHCIPSTHPSVGQSVAAVRKMRFGWKAIQRLAYESL